MDAKVTKTNKKEVAQHNNIDFATIQKQKENKIFHNLNDYSVNFSIEQFLSTLTSVHTKKAYALSFKRLNDLGILLGESSLQLLALANLNNIVDAIKQVSIWSESTRQARAACFIAFTKFLERKTESIIKRATPERTGTNKTFTKIRTKVKTEAITITQARLFIKALAERNNRDALIAKLLLQGAKRIDEVLSLCVEAISWDKNTIEFRQSKSKSEDSTIITFDHSTMSEIKQYLCGREKGLVFVSANGNKIHATQMNRAFEQVSKLVLGKKISPHVLRSTAITEYKRLGNSYEDIRKISGHKTLTQLGEYDKTSKEDNPSKTITLFQ